MDKAYLAGIIDGEGSLYVASASLPSGTKSYSARLSVDQSNEEFIRWVASMFGVGCVAEVTKKSSLGKKRAFAWRASCKEAASVLRAVIPYLKIKKRQAELLLELEENKSPRGASSVSVEAMKRREEIKTEVTSLNRTGDDYVS